ncbi:MAG TPA: ABC transporter permease [Aggregatilineales bacterium]|nr:ABC transporter permease [Aggregatilineales bacterium]
MVAPTSASSNVTSLTAQSVDDSKLSVGNSLWTIALRRLRRDYLSLAAIAVLMLIILASFGAPVIASAMHLDPDQISLDETYSPPGVNGHILGTDDLGRDQLIRLLYGGQISLAIGFCAGILSLTIGVSLGVLVGYRGGILDDFINWFITTLDSLPSLYLILLLTVIIRASMTSQVTSQSILASIPTPVLLIGILSVLSWTGTMRLVRGETFSIREREYILAARAIGARDRRIMIQHIFPNVLSVIIVTLMLTIGGLILLESALSFLGFGVQPPTSTWGNMLTNATEYFTLGPHLVFAPGILITITVLCLYVLGDGLRDAFDPKLKEKG